MKKPLEAHTLRLPTPLGDMVLAATPDGLAGAWFHDQRDAPSAQQTARWTPAEYHPVLRAAAGQLLRFFAGDPKAFDRPADQPPPFPLDLSLGTAFQQAVWGALCSIPAGQTLSYGELARRIGRPASVRAVGAAVSANPVSVLIPCHRVLGANGSLTGYSGGLPRKIALLELESVGDRLL